MPFTFAQQLVGRAVILLCFLFVSLLLILSSGGCTIVSNSYNPHPLHTFNVAQLQRGQNLDSIWASADYLSDTYTRYYFSKEFQQDSIYPYLIRLSNRTKGAIIIYTDDIPASVTDDSIYGASYFNPWRIVPVNALGSALAMYSVGYAYNLGSETTLSAQQRSNNNMLLPTIFFAGCIAGIDAYRISEWNKEYQKQLRRVCRQRVELEAGKDTSMVVFTKALRTTATDTLTFDGKSVHIPTRSAPIMDTLYLGIDKLYGMPFTIPVAVER